MKKLKLNLQQLENTEVLTRSQLRNVLGGGGEITTEPGGGGETTAIICAGDCSAWVGDAVTGGWKSGTCIAAPAVGHLPPGCMCSQSGTAADCKIHD